MHEPSVALTVSRVGTGWLRAGHRIDAVALANSGAAFEV
jgi:hypothetical protein